jgi:hypothetical protein
MSSPRISIDEVMIRAIFQADLFSTKRLVSPIMLRWQGYSILGSCFYLLHGRKPADESCCCFFVQLQG